MILSNVGLFRAPQHTRASVGTAPDAATVSGIKIDYTAADRHTRARRFRLIAKPGAGGYDSTARPRCRREAVAVHGLGDRRLHWMCPAGNLHGLVRRP